MIPRFPNLIGYNCTDTNSEFPLLICTCLRKILMLKILALQNKINCYNAVSIFNLIEQVFQCVCVPKISCLFVLFFFLHIYVRSGWPPELRTIRLKLPPEPHWAPFCGLRKRLWERGWRNNGKLHMH